MHMTGDNQNKQCNEPETNNGANNNNQQPASHGGQQVLYNQQPVNHQTHVVPAIAIILELVHPAQATTSATSTAA
jgi:hypothetical protein